MEYEISTAALLVLVYGNLILARLEAGKPATWAFGLLAIVSLATLIITRLA